MALPPIVHWQEGHDYKSALQYNFIDTTTKCIYTHNVCGAHSLIQISIPGPPLLLLLDSVVASDV